MSVEGVQVAAAQTQGAPPPQAPPPIAAAPPPPPQSAGDTMQPSWFQSFKNPELKSFVESRKFESPENVVDAYVNLEKLKGVPADRLLKLPEKMEGDEAKAVWEKLGTPKEAKEYGLFRDEKQTDHSFTDWAETTFLENNLTKQQAQGVVKKFQELQEQTAQLQQASHQQAIQQADSKLKGDWGAQYEANLNIAKQGAKILGLDAKTLDALEGFQGREALFKNLHRVGVSVGESNFVDGQSAQPATMSVEEASTQIKQLMNDQKFVKKMAKGDQEAMNKWNELNKWAAPGEKQIG